MAEAPAPEIGTLDRYTTGKLTKAEVVHLLKRTMFGIRYADLISLSSKNLTEIIDQYLLTNDATNPDLVLNALPSDYYTDSKFDWLRSELMAGRKPYNLDKMVPAPPENFYNEDYTTTYDGKTQVWKISDYDVPSGMPYVLSRSSELSNVSDASRGYIYSKSHTLDWRRFQLRIAWKTSQMVHQNISIREKMNLFWSNFFPTKSTKSYLGGYENNFRHHMGYWYDQMLRYHSLGNFRTLLRNVTTHPLMLTFLDGIVNNVNNPNQNYGRELQEVYAIGLVPSAVDNGSSYTEQDVIELSRILSGWESEMVPYGLLREKFTPSKHDYGKSTQDVKKLSSFYNNAVIGNHGITNASYYQDSNGAKGKAELDDYFNLIFGDARLKQIIAENVIRKLYRFFVNSNISAEVEAVIIQGLVKELIKANFEMKPVLRILFSSNHFYKMINRGALIKPPVDHGVGIFREFEYSLDKPERSYGHYDLFSTLAFRVNLDNGQDLEFQNAFGWRAYYDYPVYDRNWLNSSSMVSRVNHFNTIIGGYIHIYTSREFWKADFNLVDVLIKNFGIPKFRNLNTLIEELTTWLLTVPLCTANLNSLKAVMSDHPQSQGLSYNQVVDNYLNEPSNQYLKDRVTERLIQGLVYLNKTEEFHLI